MAVSWPVTRPIRDHRPERLARLHGLGPRYPPGIRGGVSFRRLAHRALRGVPGGRRQPVPGLRAHDPEQRGLADRGQRPGSRDARIRKRHRRPRLRTEPHHTRRHYLSTDQWRPRGRRHQSRVPVWTRWAGGASDTTRCITPASRFAPHPWLDLALVKTTFASSDRQAGNGSGASIRRRRVCSGWVTSRPSSSARSGGQKTMCRMV